MNYIDKNFKFLVNTIKNRTKEENYIHILETFQKIPDEIKQSLENYFHTFDYWGTLDRKKVDFEEIKLRANSLHDHLEDFIWLYERLGDYRSKQILYAIMNNWYNYDFYTLQTVKETLYKDYFDLDLIHDVKDEVLVDLGAYTGDTIIDYIATYGKDSYKQIYCYEITKDTVEILKNNLAIYHNITVQNKAASDSETPLYMNPNKTDASANTVLETGDQIIESVTIDKDILEKITMIKMDIEGAETKALIGCQNHIKNDHPKLLLSVYHNHEDIWKIPKMIEEYVPGYKFYLRYHGNNIFPTEVTLTALYNPS